MGLDIKSELYYLSEIVFAVLLMALSYMCGVSLSVGLYFPASLALGELLGIIFVLEKERTQLEPRR